MTERTALEARAEYISAMGPELGAFYSELWQEVARLHSKWDEFVVLFGEKASRIDLMNAAAPKLFRIVQDTLWEAVLLHIARLTDPAETGRGKGARQNLTVQRLPLLVADCQTRKDLDYTIKELLKACEFARDWRNRHIAHGDYDLSMGLPAAVPLKGASRLHVKAALAGFTATLNVVSLHYLDGTNNLFDSGPSIGGAMNLLHVLDDGLTVQRERWARMNAKTADLKDFEARDL